MADTFPAQIIVHCFQSYRSATAKATEHKATPRPRPSLASMPGWATSERELSGLLLVLGKFKVRVEICKVK